MKRVVRAVLSGFGICAVGAALAASETPWASGGEIRPVISGDSLDFLHVFSYASGAQTFRNVSGKALSVRYLAVGAGGCGGSVKGATSNLGGGGGGGGGGVAEDETVLAVDEAWSVYVGKGSDSASKSSGSSGPYKLKGTEAGASAVSNSTGEVVYVPGGGLGGNTAGATEGAAGGGVYGYKDYKAGKPGTFASYTLSSPTPQGPYSGGANTSVVYQVGTSNKTKYFLAGGGGGAAGNGQTPEKNGSASGNGGAGIPCDITGSVVYYGAGGGGGGCLSTNRTDIVNVLVAISGGLGGTGAGNGGTLDGEVGVAPTSGTDGLGSGGGGGVLTHNKDASVGVGGSGGDGTVIVRYHAADFNPPATTPALPSIGAIGEVTVRVAGEVETDGEGKLWLKPGSPAVLYAVDAGGAILSGWEDDETGEFIRGEIVMVTPTVHQSYTAVFGKPWTYDATANKLSNGDWTFSVTSGQYLYAGTNAPADSILNLTTPMTDSSGKTFTPTGLGLSDGDQSGREFISTSVCASVRLFLPEGFLLRNYVFGSATGTRVRGALSIPRNLALPQSAFMDCKELTKLFFEGGAEGGQTLRQWSIFSGCKNLARVSRLPDSATTLWTQVFRSCAFKSIEMPGTTVIKARAFSGVPLTNVVFSADVVTFGTYNAVYGETVFNGAAQGCCFRFPGKAPILECCGTMTVGGDDLPYTGGITDDEEKSVWSRMFGSKSGARLYGSWRADPEGWRKIRTEIGSTDWTGKTPPTLDPAAGDRRIKGTFNWSNGPEALLTGWLIDTAMPGEPPPPGSAVLIR